jgi:hypothetical protein
MGLLDFLKEDLEFFEEGEPVASSKPEEQSTESDMVKIDPKFLTSLVSFLEKKLPDYALFNDALGAELLKYADNTDMDKIRKVKQKMHKVIMAEQVKFLEKVRTRVGRIEVPKK